MHVTCTCIIIHVLVCTGITLYMYTVNTLHTSIHRYLDGFLFSVYISKLLIILLI